ncbi:hypothetical protein [Streptomyces sp. NPDC020965]|uniref:hypothetical protein n=1 Tax=Streptomyces sp. NPDC020965 TaxID=3365105 RepID=UPI00379458E0
MGWMKAKLKQAMGSKKEADGAALGDERMKREGREERVRGRDEAAELRAAARRRRHGE